MYWFIKDISPNLFFILFTALLYQFWFEKKDWSSSLKNKGIFLCSSIALLLCMSLPVEVGQGYIFDLRYIPIVIGGLYGGPVVAIGLGIVTIFFRFFIADLQGFYITIAIVFICTIITCLLSKKFLELSPKARMIWTTSIVVFIAILIAILCELSADQGLLILPVWLGYIATHFVCTLITSKLVEAIIRNDLVRKQVIKNEKLEAVSHLASSISHEVKNPLTTSRGFLQLLNEEDIPDKWRTYLKFALEEIDRAEDVVNDYLTFAKPSFEHQDNLQIDLELSRAINAITALAKMNNVRIEKRLVAGYVKGDRTKLQQCFINLMKNAIEAMPKGGLLVIACKQEEDGMRIEITDTGIGMTEHQIHRLGESYFTTKGMKGTGLGLMVVYRIIESLNGQITVKSKLGKGTSFVIKLPNIKMVKTG